MYTQVHSCVQFPYRNCLKYTILFSNDHSDFDFVDIQEMNALVLTGNYAISALIYADQTVNLERGCKRKQNVFPNM